MTACGASFAVSSPPCGLMSKIAILQPSSASRSVNPRPMPCPPPVTTATFPDRPFNADLLSLVVLLALADDLGIPEEGGLSGRSVLLDFESALRIHLPRD